MVSISGIVYIVIGLAVSIASYIINRSAKANSLTLFMYVGIVFVIVGVIKLVIWQKSRPEKAHHAQHMPQQGTHQAGHPQQAHPPHAASRQQGQSPEQHRMHILHEGPAPSVTTIVTPTNKVERLIIEQEKHQGATLPAAHPPIVHCPHCGRRQYATRPTCFSCNRPL